MRSDPLLKGVPRIILKGDVLCRRSSTHSLGTPTCEEQIQGWRGSVNMQTT